jgi:NAD(P)-dependent dehydrogenase (short-subunit alcohol dehydrogenase family)
LAAWTVAQFGIAVFLTKPAASDFVTGAEIPVDGGYSAMAV